MVTKFYGSGSLTITNPAQDFTYQNAIGRKQSVRLTMASFGVIMTL
jgi:hypothetical protein